MIGIFKYAKKKKLTELSISNFFGDLDLSKKIFRKNVKEINQQVFLEEEIPLMLEALRKDGSIEALACVLVFQTGMRVGEIASLKREDVNFNERTISIRRMEIKYKSEEIGKQVHEVVEYTKSDNGMRDILITEKTIQTIKEIIKLNPFGDYLFEKNGKRIFKENYNDKMIHTCEKLGIEKRSIHKARKTYGTTLIDANVDESLILKQMGHSDIKCTKEYYYYCNRAKEGKLEQIQKAISF